MNDITKFRRGGWGKHKAKCKEWNLKFPKFCNVDPLLKDLLRKPLGNQGSIS